jgi:hypothetical protein
MAPYSIFLDSKKRGNTLNLHAGEFMIKNTFSFRENSIFNLVLTNSREPANTPRTEP